MQGWKRDQYRDGRGTSTGMEGGQVQEWKEDKHGNGKETSVGGLKVWSKERKRSMEGLEWKG